MYTIKQSGTKRIIILSGIGIVLFIVVLVIVTGKTLRIGTQQIPPEWVGKLFDISNVSFPAIPQLNSQPPLFNNLEYIKLQFFSEKLPVKSGTVGRDNPFIPFEYLRSILRKEQVASEEQNASVEQNITTQTETESTTPETQGESTVEEETATTTEEVVIIEDVKTNVGKK